MSFYYIGYYTKNGNPNNFLEFPGCSIKMSYIINCMKINNIAIDVICLGESKENITHKSQSIKIDSLENNFFVGTTRKTIINSYVGSRHS